MFGINHDFSRENAPLVEHTSLVRIPPPRFAEAFLTSSEVMTMLGYKDRGSFWFFVRSKGVPHIVLNQRRIVFDRRALNAWLARRAVGKHPDKIL